MIDDGAVASVDQRVAAVGTTGELKARFHPRELIDAYRKIVMPGLIDGHGHAGHETPTTLGADRLAPYISRAPSGLGRRPVRIQAFGDRVPVVESLCQSEM